MAAETAKLAKDIGDKAPDQRQQRDLLKQAYQQTQLGAATEALNGEINDLNQTAAQVGEPEAIRALADAQKAVKRGQPQAKMAGAVIDLKNGKPGVANDEQQKAGDALKKIVENLQASSDALAASRDAQLNRANRAAEDAKKNLDVLLAQAGIKAKSAEGKGEQAKAGTDAGAQAKAGTEAGAQAKAGTEAGAQAGRRAQQKAGRKRALKPRPVPKPALKPRPAQKRALKPRPGQKRRPAAAGTQAGAEAKAGTGAQAKAGQKRRSGEGRRATMPASPAWQNAGGDEVRKLAYNLSQLTAAIDNRQLLPQDQVDQLKQMTVDKAELEKKLAVDPKFVHDVSDLVGNIGDKIEAEMEAKTEASKLFSSQREECPPIYRQFVNKYFEALSQVAPAPDAGNKPEQPGQP